MELEGICFQMITEAGEAKSCYMEALEAAAEKDARLAEAKMEEGDRAFSRAHESHGELIRRESGGEPVTVSLLLAHVEDQLMSAEVIRVTARELIRVYGRLDERNGGLK